MSMITYYIIAEGLVLKDDDTLELAGFMLS